MWHAMSPQSMALPPHMQQSSSQTTGLGPGGGPQTTTQMNPDGSSTVYVHHINAPQAQQQPPPPPAPQSAPAFVPYPMPMPAPAPSYYPPPPSYGCPYQMHQHHQQQQPQVIIMQEQRRADPPTTKEEPDPRPAPAPPPAVVPSGPPPDAAKQPPPKKLGPQKFSKFSVVSVIIFFLALIFGIACVIKTYEAFDGREAGLTHDDEEYVVDRTVAVGTGAAATLCFTIATLCSFYAGMRHKSRSKSKKTHCCAGGLVIAAWIIFCLTFVNDLIILVLAFDGDNVIYPEVVWSALIGSILSWMLMFGFSEITRRQG